MNYIKKTCILRQLKQGFSGDGKTLSGLIKIEQYGKNLAIEVSVINFAPLVFGDYYCVLADGNGKTEMLSLRGKSIFNILSDIDISDGFCGIICYVKDEIHPIAYGINGNGNYDWRVILNATMPPSFSKSRHPSEREYQANDLSTKQEISMTTESLTENLTETENSVIDTPKESATYDDERVATENYYKENSYECEQFTKIDENVENQSATTDATTEKGASATENGNVESLLHPIKTDPDGYYLSVKGEIDQLFANYPKDETLCGAFSCSEWVRIKGSETDPKYLVGVLYDDGRAKYICYA